MTAAVLAPPAVPLARPRHLLLALLVLVAALLALQVEGLTPRLLPRPAAVPAAGAEATSPPPDVAGAAGAAQATRVGPAAEPGVLEARDPGYRALFDADGFSFQPAGATAPLRIDLAAVTVGGRPVDLDLGRWSADASVLERPVAASLTERVTARDGEVEWDVVVARALPGSGDLVVRGDLSGTAGDAVVEDGSLLVPLAGGATAPIGEVVVKDAGGAVLHRGLPTVTDDGIELVVPASALDGARYPVTVDPTVGQPQTLTGPGARHDLEIAWSGGPNGTHLVAWAEPVAGQWDIYGVVIADDGGVRTAPRQLSFAPTDDLMPDVAWIGDKYVVVFVQPWPPTPTESDIRAQFVDRNGTLIGTTIGLVTTTSDQQDAAVTATSTGFTLAWSDDRAGSQDRWDVYAGRYTPAGVPQDGTGVRMSTDVGPAYTNEYDPDLAWNGTSTMVVWEEDDNRERELRMARLFPDGRRDTITNGVWRGGHDYWVAAIASDGDRWLVVFEDHTRATGAVDIMSVLVFPENGYSGVNPISQQPGNEGRPAVAYGLGGYLVALTDRRHPNDPDIRAVRLDRNGARLDHDTFFVEGRTNVNDVPAVSPGRNGGWAVTYQDLSTAGASILWRHAK